MVASVVANTAQVRDILHIPCPKVLAWNSRAAPSNPVKAGYIIMEKTAGTELGQHWDSLNGKEKYAIVQQLVELERRFTSIRFAAYGSLYYKDNLPPATMASMP
jgi:hypothetical protein